MNNLKKVLGVDDPSGLVEEMRSLGIVELRSGEWGISIGITHTDRTPVYPSVFEDESKEEICACRHGLWEHNDDGYCLNGCVDCGTPQETGK